MIIDIFQGVLLAGSGALFILAWRARLMVDVLGLAVLASACVVGAITLGGMS